MTTKRTTLRSFTDGMEHVLSLSHEHNKIHEGKVFRYSDSITLGASATQVYLITTPSALGSAPHFTFNIDGTLVTSVDLYEGADRTGTAIQTLLNANRNSPLTAATTIHKGISGGTTDGTRILMYSSGAANEASRSMAENEYDKEWILKSATKYLLRITSGTAGNLINFQPNWYES